MGLGNIAGQINELIDALSRPVREASDASPNAAYRRLPKQGVTKRLPEGYRGGLGGEVLRQLDPEYGIGWRSHLVSGVSADPVYDADMTFDPADDIGPTRTDRTRAMAFRDAQMAAAMRMQDTMRTNSAIADQMANAADEVEMERRARSVGRTTPFDVASKYADLPGNAPTVWGALNKQSVDWGNLLTEGDPIQRRMDLRAIRQLPEFGRLAPEIQQGIIEQLQIDEAARMSDSVYGDTKRFERDMNRLANPPRVQGESAARMLMRGGGAMGMPALDILSLLMGAAVGRNPIDPGPMPEGMIDDRSRLALELASSGM